MTPSGWIQSSKKTTLGADNGVAIAAGLAMLRAHGDKVPMELLLTVNEETDFRGAEGKASKDLSGMCSRIKEIFLLLRCNTVSIFDGNGVIPSIHRQHIMDRDNGFVTSHGNCLQRVEGWARELPE